ncbi:MAG TPA: methyltransferase domain-containing protein [Acidobacteriaceae bacterium]|nr:methyltransferase domain-containing protein [Acidobacteriaceae bacterium]
MNIHDRWQAGVQSEVDFWRSVCAGVDFPEFTQELMQRIDPHAPVANHLLPYLPTEIPVADTKILDVAAGPVSCIGWQIDGQRPQVTPIDALARRYRTILDEFNLVPPVYTQQCDGEDICDLFKPDFFDLVHIRNALDHCYDALAVMRNMLAVLKPGGALIVCGYTDEAVFEKYAGLHQWNIRADNGAMIIWRPNEHYDVNKTFSSQLGAVETSQDDSRRWTSVVLRKKTCADG